MGLRALNATPISLALLAPLARPEGRPAFQQWWGTTDPARIEAAAERLEEIAGEIGQARPEVGGDLVCREIAQATRLARHGLLRLGLRLYSRGPDAAELRRDLEGLIEEQAQVWRARSRPGGLENTLDRLRNSLRDYA